MQKRKQDHSIILAEVTYKTMYRYCYDVFYKNFTIFNISQGYKWGELLDIRITHLLFQAYIRDKTYRWERFMYQRDERLTGDPYKANVSKI